LHRFDLEHTFRLFQRPRVDRSEDPRPASCPAAPGPRLRGLTPA